MPSTTCTGFAANVGLAGTIETRAKRVCPRVNSCRMVQTYQSMKHIKGISEIASSYKCFLLDQFGVIHDGQRIYDCAKQALNELHKAGIKIIIISNSSRRAHTTYEKLQTLGIDTDIISGVVTSGELALTKLRKFASENPRARVLHFNWGASRNSVSLADHGLEELAPCTQVLNGFDVPASSEIDVIIAHGIDGLTRGDGSVMDLDWETAIQLVGQIARDAPSVPFFCANPDLVTVEGTVLRRMPGALAKVFEDSGGINVHRLGKPSRIAYDEALRISGVRKEEVVAVGDSIGHDILGAVRAKIDSLFIAGGIHAEDFGIESKNEAIDDNGVEDDAFSRNSTVFGRIVRDEGIQLGDGRPTYVSSFFRW